MPWELLSTGFTHPIPSNVGILIGNGKAKWLEKEIGRRIATHYFRQRSVTWGSSLLSSVSTHHQEEQMKHQGYEIHTNMHEFSLLSRGFFALNLPSAKANLCELVQCCLEFLTIEVSLVCHVLFPKQLFRCQICDSSNATIDWEIPSLGAGSLLVDDAHGRGNLPDALPHLIIYLLCCQATLILTNPHGFCCPLADSNTGVLGPDTDL